MQCTCMPVEIATSLQTHLFICRHTSMLIDINPKCVSLIHEMPLSPEANAPWGYSSQHSTERTRCYWWRRMQNSENQCRTTPCKWLTVSPQSCCHLSLDTQPIRFSKFKDFSLWEQWVSHFTRKHRITENLQNSLSKTRTPYPQQLFYTRY